ncbi:YybH family protein [Pontibacter sp. MBLB2868]|uniref:YybH family protein n=1 Tax=Pontibacter sp. MBLB2868 TaxID=3451555 RepID=UPI003F756A5C
MKITTSLFLALLLCAFQSANNTRDKALTSLADAERNFSATSEAKGFHQAFVDNMAEDGLVFAPKPTHGKKLHAQAPESPMLLTWYPAYADISSSLDWGYTTGPYQLKLKPEDEKAAAAGFYLSVWRKQPDGQWKVAVDLGNSFSPGLLKEEAYQPLMANTKEKKAKGSKEDLLAKDVQPVQPYFDETLIYREGEYPYKYKDGVIEPASNVVYSNLGHELSPAADMAYTYGSYTQPTSKGEETGHYLKVWKVVDGQWKLVAHNLVPDRK